MTKTETAITWGCHAVRDDDGGDCYDDGSSYHQPEAPPAPDGEGWSPAGAGFASPGYIERGMNVRHVERDTPYIIWVRQTEEDDED